MPVQKDATRYARSKGMVSCLTHGEHAFATDSALSYVSVLPAVQHQQVAADPDLAVWVTAVSAAKGRTSDNLGSTYPRVSQLLSGAVQASMSGATDAATALSAAQVANARA
jgi:multiple sugar transport system substrate-binding protein